ncbi:MAG: uroporphyrinogen decarboxylase family protein [Armatimonadota bacterium]|nr:uroporphyrinogen decarboxylase family protein [Armatimonadota bacterium]
MLTGRARVLAAFSPEGTEEFPVLLPYLGIFVRDHREAISPIPWWRDAAADVSTAVRVARHLLRRVPIDWMEAEPGPPRAWRQRHRAVWIRGRPFLEDVESGQRRLISREPPGGTCSLPRRPLIRGYEDLDRLLPPSSGAPSLSDGTYDRTRALVSALGRNYFLFASIGAPFWSAYGYLSFEGVLRGVVEQAELLHALLERITERALEAVRAYAAAGVDGVWVEECLTSADILSPMHFRRFALPYTARLIEEIERSGMRAVYYFCGDGTDRLEDLIATGATALAFEESKKGFRVELEEVAEAVRGRCALLGNLDAVNVLERGDGGALRAALARQAAVGRRWRRFAFSLGSPVTALTPVSRVAEYVWRARAAGR